MNGRYRCRAADCSRSAHAFTYVAPRSATVRTKSQLTVSVIGKNAMSQVLSRNPNLADQFGTILTARQSELAATRETADRAARLKPGAGDGRSLTAKILTFFGLSSN